MKLIKVDKCPMASLSAVGISDTVLPISQPRLQQTVNASHVEPIEGYIN